MEGKNSLYRKCTKLILAALLMLCLSTTAYADVTITATDSAAGEPANNGLFTVTISPAVAGDTVVNYNVSGSTATAGSDYSALSGSVTVPDGSASATIPVNVLDNPEIEGDESVVVTLTGANNGQTLGAAVTDSVTIADDDSATVSISASTNSLNEGGSVDFTVTLSERASTNTTVNLTSSGAAVEGTDYGSIPSSVVIPAGSLNDTISVSTNNDSIVESNESFTVSIDSVSGDPQISVGTVSDTVTINDNDNATVSVGVSSSTVTENSSVDFIFTLTNVSSSSTTVDISSSGPAVEGTDYSALPANVTIPADQASTTLTVTALNNNIIEGNTSFDLNVDGVSGDPQIGLGTPLSQTVTINDDDTGTVDISASDASADESGDPGEFTISLSDISTTDTVVSLSTAGTATEGSDYAAIPTSVTILAGDLQETVTITPSTDSLIEPDETVIVSIAITSSDPDISTGTNIATVTLNDDDSGTVSISATDAAATETGDPGEFTIQLSQASATNTVVAIAVAGSASEGTDYSNIPSSVTFIPAGTLSETIAITPLTDAIIEADETVELTVSISSGDPDITIGTATDIVTIADDDSGTVSIAATDSTATEGGDTGQFTVSLTDVSSTDTQIALNIAGSATNGVDYANIPATVTIPAGSGNQTITVDAFLDNILEFSENVQVSLTGIPSGDSDISINAGADSDTVTIDNGDQAEFSVADASINEDSGTLNFTISVGSALDGPTVTVDYDTTDNASAQAGVDYTATSGNATINGSGTATVSVPLTPDLTVERDETFVLTLSNPVASAPVTTVMVDATAQGTIINDDIPVFTINDSDVLEGDVGTIPLGYEVTVDLDIASDVTVLMDYQVQHTTTTVADFTGTLSNSLSWTNTAAGTVVALPIEVTNDVLVERDETYTVELNNGVIVGGSGTPDTTDAGIGVIRNNDSPELTLVTSSRSDNEGDAGTTTLDYRVESDLNVADDAQVTFDYIVADVTTDASPLDLQTGTFVGTITSGSSVDVPVILNGDTIVEEDETYSVTISNPQIVDSAAPASITSVPGADTASGTILNDDIPTISVNNSSLYEGSRSGTTDPGFVVQSNLAIADDVTVSFDWEVILGVGAGFADAADFATTPLNGTVSVSNLGAAASIPVPLLINRDFDVEEDETYTIELTNGIISGNAGTWTFARTASGEILNDEHYITMTAPTGVTIEYTDPVTTFTSIVTDGSTDVVVERSYTPSFEVIIGVGDGTDCYHIDEINADGVTLDGFGNTDERYTFTFSPVLQDETITASRTIDLWTITSQIIGEAHGTITASDGRVLGTSNSSIDTVVQGCTDPENSISSTDDHHITFVNLDGSPVNGPHTAPFTETSYVHTFTNIGADHTLAVAFTQFVQVIEDSPFGTITPDPGSPPFIEYAYNSIPSFDIEALAPCSDGHTHHISDILVDDVSSGIRGTGEVGPYTYVYPFNLTYDSTIEVQFTGWVDVDVSGPGQVRLGAVSVSGTGSIEFEADTDQIFEIVPNVGFHVSEVLLDGVNVGRVTEYNFNEVVPEDHTLEVTFATNWYSLEASSTYNTVYDDAGESVSATTRYPLHGTSESFYVDLNDPLHAIEAIFIDNNQISIPAAGSTFTDPGGEFVLTNTGNDTLEVQFTNVAASHRLVVIDYDETPISDIPLVATAVTAPANIMFIIDDSGSMDWSVLVPGVEQGKYCSGGTGTYCSGGTRYESILEPGGQLPLAQRMQWKSQWYEYNKMYYNPTVKYIPWPRIVEVSQNVGDLRTVANADTTAPRFHPLDSSQTLVLSNEFATVNSPASSTQIVDAGDVAFSHSNDWGTSANANAYGDDEYWYASNDDSNKWAEWEFTPAADGEYGVYISWSNSNNNRRDIPYTISCPTCSPAVNDVVTVNQDHDGWALEGPPRHLLGRYDFESGETVTIRMDDNHQDTSTSSLDGVRLSSNLISIPNAHYYMWSNDDSAPYLITFDDSTTQIRYYRATGVSIDNAINNSNDIVTQIEEVTGAAIPADVVVTDSYADALQNFSNWVTYYRERRCAALAGVARALVKMENVQVGLTSLWADDLAEVEPVQKVKVEGEDYTDDLLESLYSWNASGGTPLIYALEEVGEYFANTDTNSWSQTLGSPYASEADGGTCQQCFAILMTDGYYNNNDEASMAYDDADDNNNRFVDAGGDSLYASPYEETLADVAMHFYETDLSPLDDMVPTSPSETPTNDDIANWQHMVTYTVSFGLSGTLNPDDYELDTTATTPNYPNWPDPVQNEQTTIDDLWHAAVNGRGQFLNATNPDDLVQSLIAITENIGKRTGSASSVSINGDELYEAIGSDIRMYQTSFNTNSWYGDLRSYRIVSSTADEVYDTNGDGVFDNSEWSASDEMQSRAFTDRDIFTFNGGGKSLTWANLSTTQQTALYPYFLFPLGAGIHPVNIGDELVLDYLLGDATHEGTYYRDRLEPFGDFVDSQATFEDGVLYVGGNDGMLHAFDADDSTDDGIDGGTELFAYIPGLVYPDLRELANPAYSHKFYVDNTPTVEKISSSLTLLVGGLGKGGKGYYALNVANPFSFSESDVLWEFPAAPTELISAQTTITFSNPGGGNDIIRDSANGFTDSAFDVGNHIRIIGADCDGYSNNGFYEILAKNSAGEIEVKAGSLIDSCGNGETVTITASITETGMGYSFSNALIIDTNDQSIGTGALKGKVIIFGNGYASEDGTAQLFIINPADGTLIKKIDTGVGPGNGMSTPKAIDVDNDLQVDYVYAGDLSGNMWKFDFTSSSYTDWQVAFCDGGDFANHCQAAGAVPQPLFKGLSNQPITAAPDVMRHPTYQGYMVIYGTGKFLGLPDLESTYLQSFYGLWDWAPDDDDLGYLGERLDSLEDIDGDGNLDVDEDLDDDGNLDAGEDIDGDGNLDVDEDLNGNGIIDALTPTLLSNGPALDVSSNSINTLLRQEVIVEGELTEDTDGDGKLDTVAEEDSNGNGILDPSEDLDGDGNWDVDEDVNNNGGAPDTYFYLRIPTSYEPDWSVDSSNVPQKDLGWYFDLPGKLTDNDNIDNDKDGTVDETGERSTGERVTSDTIIRDGRAILISYGVSGATCDVGMFSFLNERNARTGGSFSQPVLDIDGNGIVNEFDLVFINFGGEIGLKGIPTDNAYEGRIFNPAILQDPENPGTEKKFMSTITGQIKTISEKGERRGVYYWQQIE